MKFLCDEMLAGLGRWLRAAGYDTGLTDRGSRDRDILERAIAEDRILLTRDRHLLQFRGATGRVCVLGAEGIEPSARELKARFGLDWLHRPFSRCMVCNTALVDAGEDMWERVPEAARSLGGPLTRCPGCDRLYWHGSHTRRMRTRLEELARRET